MNRIAILSLAAFAFGLSTASAADKGTSVAHGRALFLSSGCKNCHGTQGQGTGSAPKLAPDPMPAEGIAQFIRGSGTRMPTYSAKVLSDADVADIAAYLASLPAAKSPDTIAALKDLKP